MSHVKQVGQRRVRHMKAEDLQECFDAGEKHMREYFPYADRDAMQQACLENIDEVNVLLIRTDHAFGCAVIHTSMIDPRPWVREEWVWGEVWEVVSILREMIAWRDRIGAFRFTFGSLTPYNFAGIARYLKLTSITDAYNFDAE